MCSEIAWSSGRQVGGQGPLCGRAQGAPLMCVRTPMKARGCHGHELWLASAGLSRCSDRAWTGFRGAWRPIRRTFMRHRSQSASQRPPGMSMHTMVFKQHEIRLPAMRRGCHLVTDYVVREISSSLKTINVGLCHVFIQHTSASLTLNENADPDVRVR